MTSRLKVLYIHGLESGPNGRKAHTLKQEFDVCSADMKMHSTSLRHRNSFVRKGINQHLVPFLLAVTALIVAIRIKQNVKYVLYAMVAVYVLCLAIFRKRWKGCLVSASFDACLQVQKQAIAEFRPDIVVGSSWGGAIAFELLKQNIWNGPCVLLCPAYLPVKSICSAQTKDGEQSLMERATPFARETLLIPYEPQQKWLIYHADDDQVVDIKDSQLMVQCNADCFELHTVERGGHALKTFVESKQLNRVIKQYMNVNAQPL